MSKLAENVLKKKVGNFLNIESKKTTTTTTKTIWILKYFVSSINKQALALAESSKADDEKVKWREEKILKITHDNNEIRQLSTAQHRHILVQVKITWQPSQSNSMTDRQTDRQTAKQTDK